MLTLFTNRYRRVIVFCLLSFFLSGLAQTGFCQSLKTEDTYHRIISLYSAHTENLVSLGASEQIIGISSADDYPPSILHKPRFSYREGPEKFIAAGADLILIRPMIERSASHLLKKLRQAGITIISLQPTSLEEIPAYWKTLGQLTGRESEAREMIHTFNSGLQAMAAKIKKIPMAKRPHVYFESIHKKMKTFAPQGIAAFVLKQAGGINVADDATQVRRTNIAAYGKERILAKAREIDIFLAQHGRMNPVSIKQIRSESGFQAIKAVRENRIYLIEEALVSRPGLRMLEGIEKVHAILYPPAANDKNN